ncbi:MAG: efflux RND transporter periplasmic adaptor subunit [Candidatus Omnitrophica bacterium]|jgi:multidrug efflux pump subunit AcrA (membrane-fusion protein)|nr:efflux RND transporter periplasmic adaptor subunit [Candidatus Omnitrophota bacterium]
MKIRNAYILPLIIACLLFLTGCHKETKVKNGNGDVYPVKVSKVQLRDLDDIIEYVGNVKAQDEAVVYPKAAGKIIKKLKQEGDIVAKAEPILLIDRDEVGLKFENSPVESPIDGVVGRVYVDIGENVSAQSKVALVVNMDTVKINLDIPEKYLSKISLGQEAKVGVDAYPKEEFPGKITKINPVVDIASRSAQVEITVDNPKHFLKSGMFARASLVLEKRSKIVVVMKESVIGKGPDTYIYTVSNDTASLKKVSLGLRYGAYYEIKNGLSAGDQVVVMGQQKLFEGAKVKVEQ